MARQITYANDSSVSALDRLTGIDSVDRSTKNFTIEAIAQLFASTGLADVSKLAFFYNYNASNSASSQGQAYYSFVAPNQMTGADELNGTPAGITQIIFNQFDSARKDFGPLATVAVGSHLKLTSVGNAADTNYGIYQVIETPSVNNGIVTINVNHLASSGTLPNDEISITLLASSATGQGIQVFDGTSIPNFEAFAGDLYFRFDDSVTPHIAEIYIRRQSSWELEANLIGAQGEMGDQGFQGIGINTISGSTPVLGEEVTVTITLDNPAGNPTTNQTFIVPAGAKGNTGDNVDPNAIRFTENGLNIDVTYEVAGEPVINLGSFVAPIDGTPGRSVVSIDAPANPGQPGATDIYTINYNIAPLTSTFSVYNGTNGTNVTATNNADGSVTITQEGNTPATINNLTATDVTNGVRIDQNNVPVATIINGSNGINGTGFKDFTFVGNSATPEVFAVGVTAVDANGNETILDLGDVTNGTDGNPGVSVTAIDQVDALNSNTVITTTTPGVDIFLRFSFSTGTPVWFTVPAGAMGAGTGTSHVDDLVIDGGFIKVDEDPGGPIGTGIQLDTTPTDNDNRLVSSKAVRDGLLGKEDTISATNRVDAEFVGTGAITNAEFNTLDGVTSSIQTQFTGKVNVDGDQVINGNKVFSQTPKGANPAANSDDTSLATTEWVRDHITTGGAGATDLGTDNNDGDSIDITSSNGNSATLNEATTTLAGLLGANDKDKLNTVARDADQTPTWVPDTDPDYITISDVPTTVIDGEDLAAAKNTLGIPDTFAPTDAEANVDGDWDANPGEDGFINNKPTELGDFINDQAYIRIGDVPIRSVDFQRRAADEVRIDAATGELILYLAAGAGAFTYGFTPNIVPQVDGSLSNFTINISGLDASHTAVITAVNFEDSVGDPITTGISATIATGGQSFEVFPIEADIDVGVITIRPTVTSTNTAGTGVVTPNITTAIVTYEVTAPLAAPTQSDYFYYGVSDVDITTAAAAAASDLDVAEIAAVADADGNLLATVGGTYTTTRDRTNEGNKTIVLGDNAHLAFVAIPTSLVTTNAAGDIIGPVFHDLSGGAGGFIAPFDYSETDTINAVPYTIFKQPLNANVTYRIDF